MTKFLFSIMALLFVFTVPVVSFGSDDAETVKTVSLLEDVDHVDVIHYMATPVVFESDALSVDEISATVNDYDISHDKALHSTAIILPENRLSYHRVVDRFNYLELKDLYSTTIFKPIGQWCNTYAVTDRSIGVYKTLNSHYRLE